MKKLTTKQAKVKATALHSLIVRARGVCERCGAMCSCPQRPEKHTSECRLQCAHIVSRRYDRTRTLEANGMCLCSGCHYTLTNDPLAHVRFVDARIGAAAHEALDEKARPTSGQRFDWHAELARLEAVFAEVCAAGYARSPFGDTNLQETPQ